MTTETITLCDVELGRIVADPVNQELKAWDFNGEYLGQFGTPSEAMDALYEAVYVHQSLRDAYNNRNL